MVQIKIQSPLDQPSGKNRLFTSIQAHLHDSTYDSFRMVVAFAKVGPLLRLEKDFDEWLEAGKSIEAIFGIDEKGTSIEAIEFAYKKFNSVYIAHVQAGAFNPTFHPKIYHFEGENESQLYIGSNNLTVGGIESNSESNISLTFSHDTDPDLLENAHTIWDETLTFSKKIDEEFSGLLVSSGMVISETAMRASRGAAKKVAVELGANPGSITQLDFPKIKIVRPSALPKSTLESRTRASTTQISSPMPSNNPVSASAEGLVIQISPHRNGEVFLSKLAVDQNHAFFEFPFVGRTVPKINGNPSYPQRDPDPIVDINLYSSNGTVSSTISNFALNTVFYEAKSEIRITVPQAVIQATPPYSILVMSKPEDLDKDYILDIYIPGSEQYSGYLESCNQTMPSGGNAQPRKFGWI